MSHFFLLGVEEGVEGGAYLWYFMVIICCTVYVCMFVCVVDVCRQSNFFLFIHPLTKLNTRKFLTDS